MEVQLYLHHMPPHSSLEVIGQYFCKTLVLLAASEAEVGGRVSEEQQAGADRMAALHICSHAKHRKDT